jgi:hypothetical protein
MKWKIRDLFGLDHAAVADILENGQKRGKDGFCGGGILSAFVNHFLIVQVDMLSLTELNKAKTALQLNDNLVEFLYAMTDFFGQYSDKQTADQVKMQTNHWATVTKAMIWRSKASEHSLDVTPWVPVLTKIIEWIIHEKTLKTNAIVPFLTPTAASLDFAKKVSSIDKQSTASYVASDEGTPFTYTSSTDSIEQGLGNLTIVSENPAQQVSKTIDIKESLATLQLSRNFLPTSLPIIANEKNILLKSFEGLIWHAGLGVNPGDTDHMWGELTTHHTTFKQRASKTPWQGSICQDCGAFRVVPDVALESTFFVVGMKHCPGSLNQDWIGNFQQILIEEYLTNKLASLGNIKLQDLISWEFLEEGMIAEK